MRFFIYMIGFLILIGGRGMGHDICRAPAVIALRMEGRTLNDKV